GGPNAGGTGRSQPPRAETSARPRATSPGSGSSPPWRTAAGRDRSGAARGSRPSSPAGPHKGGWGPAAGGNRGRTGALAAGGAGVGGGRAGGGGAGGGPAGRLRAPPALGRRRGRGGEGGAPARPAARAPGRRGEEVREPPARRSPGIDAEGPGRAAEVGQD